MEIAFSARFVANVSMERFRPEMDLKKAKVILELEPQLKVGKKHEALLHQRFIEGIARASQPGSKFDTMMVHEAYQFLQQVIKEQEQGKVDKFVTIRNVGKATKKMKARAREE